MQMNTGNQCGVCFKNFGSAFNLRRHSVVHTKEKPYVCNYCAKGFTQVDTLKSHIKNIHFNQQQ